MSRVLRSRSLLCLAGLELLTKTLEHRRPRGQNVCTFASHALLGVWLSRSCLQNTLTMLICHPFQNTVVMLIVPHSKSTQEMLVIKNVAYTTRLLDAAARAGLWLAKLATQASDDVDVDSVQLTDADNTCSPRPGRDVQGFGSAAAANLLAKLATETSANVTFCIVQGTYAGNASSTRPGRDVQSCGRSSNNQPARQAGS